MTRQNIQAHAKSRTGLAIAVGLALLASSPALAAAPAPAAASKPAGQVMTYEVYAGGINAVTAKLDIAYEPGDRYHIALEARTKGFLGKVAPWVGSFVTDGWRLGKSVNRPELHRSVATWHNEEEINEYSYGKDGSFKGLKSVNEGKDVSPTDLTPDLTDGTTDVLTATLQIMESIAKTGRCEGSSEVFDGARRYELIFAHEADEDLAATRYNVYKGPAVRCSAEVRPIVGKWHTKPRGWMSIQEQGRQQGSLPTVWMAKIDPDGPAVPVKIRVKTDYGTLFMHMIRYNNGTGERTAEETGEDESGGRE